MRRYVRLLRYAAPHWHGWALILAATLVSAGLGLLQPWPMQLPVDHVLGSRPPSRGLAALLVWLPGAGTRVGLLAYVALGALAIFALNSVIGALLSTAWIRVGQQMVYDLAGDLFAHLQRHQVTELPPIVCVTTEYRLHARTCPACRRPTWADLPAGVPHGAFGPRFQAVCSLLTGGYGLSRRATQELVRDLLGEEVSLGTLCSLEAATAQALSAPYQEVRAAVAQAARVNADETRWWFDAHRPAWLWLAATDQLSLFRVDASRSREAFERLLPARAQRQRRTVTSDRYSAYCHLVDDEWQICWGHLDREFVGWAESTGKAACLGKAAKAASVRLFCRWHQYRAGELSHAAMAAYLEPVKERLRATLKEAAASRHWRVEGPARHLLKHFESLFTFARVEGVEPTNNDAERALRRGVLWRKRSFGHQSESGRAFVERLLTVVGSLRLQGRNVLAYLEAACRAALTGTGPPSLTPHPCG
jgi:transposase